MGSSTVPKTLAALVGYATLDLAQFPVTVSYGMPVTDDTSDVLAFGIGDLSSGTDGYAATADQAPGPNATTRPRDETGSVVCIAYAHNGDGDAQAACEAAFSYMAAVENRLRTTPSLGIQGTASNGYYVASMGLGHKFDQQQTETGAEAFVVFNVAFVARI